MKEILAIFGAEVMSGGPLDIRKLSYSNNPWRITLDGEELWVGGQPHFAFQRKRDAMPFLARLLEVGDWANVTNFTREQIVLIHQIASETDAAKQFRAIVRGAA